MTNQTNTTDQADMVIGMALIAIIFLLFLSVPIYMINSWLSSPETHQSSSADKLSDSDRMIINEWKYQKLLNNENY